MSKLSRRERIRWWGALASMVLAAIATGPVVVAAKALGLTQEQFFTALFLVWSPAILWGLVTGLSRVRVGLDRVELRGALKSFTVHQRDIVSFRYVGALPAPREWYIETSGGALLPLGAGDGTTMAVYDMLRQWPWLPRPSGEAIRSLGAADYRHETREPAELVQILRIPSLAPEERLRVARIVAQMGPAHRAEVERIADATLDAEQRARLREL